MADQQQWDTQSEADQLTDSSTSSWAYTIPGIILLAVALWLYNLTDARSLISLGAILVLLFAAVALLYTGYGLRKDRRKLKQKNRHAR